MSVLVEYCQSLLDQNAALIVEIANLKEQIARERPYPDVTTDGIIEAYQTEALAARKAADLAVSNLAQLKLDVANVSSAIESSDRKVAEVPSKNRKK